MNRDQTINKCIQNFIENDSEKIEKTLKIIIVEAAQKRKPARGPLGARLPRAQAAAWAWAGILAPTRLPLGPLLARSPPTVPSRPSPPIKIGRPGALFAGSKPDDAVSPQTLGHSPLISLSTGRRRRPLAMVAGRSGRGGATAACSPARARSSEGERAAVEPAVDGAMLSSPARATPASRSGDPGVPRTGGDSGARTR